MPSLMVSLRRDAITYIASAYENKRERMVAWSVDVQTVTRVTVIVSGLQKRTCEKVAYMHFAILHGRLTNGYNI